MSARKISRRTVLRGVGCTMALPWLESLHALADTPAASAFPKRFAVMFLGNGINEDHWSAEGTGAAMKLSKTLEPLEPLKQKINVIDGLFVKSLTGQGIHPAQTGSLLSGAHISKGAIIHSGISVDQMIANQVGDRHAAVEHRAGLRTAHDRVSRDEFFAGVQFAHLLADAGFAGAGGSLSVAGLGQSVRQSRQPAEPEHSRPRERSRGGSDAQDQFRATRASSTNI